MEDCTSRTPHVRTAAWGLHVDGKLCTATYSSQADVDADSRELWNLWLGGSLPVRVHSEAAGAHTGMGGTMSPPPQEVLLPSLIREVTSFTLRIQTSSLVQKRKSY